MGKNKKNRNTSNMKDQLPIKALTPPTIKRKTMEVPAQVHDRYLLDINANGEGLKSMLYHTFFHILMFLLVPLAIIVSRVLGRRIKWFNVGPVPKERFMANRTDQVR